MSKYDLMSDDDLMSAINAKIGGGQQGGGMVTPQQGGGQMGGGMNTPTPQNPRIVMGDTPSAKGIPLIESSRTIGGRTKQPDPLYLLQESEKIKNILKEQFAITEQGIKGISSDLSGRVTLAKDSIRRVKNIMNILFPDGTPESYRRSVSWGANYPVGKLPFLPRATPDIPGVSFDDDFARDTQMIASDLDQAISGKLLIQTGVASNPEERTAMHEAYDPGLWVSGEKLYSQLEQLRDFYSDFMKTVDPKGYKGVNVAQEQSGKLDDGTEWEILNG